MARRSFHRKKDGRDRKINPKNKKKTQTHRRMLLYTRPQAVQLGRRVWRKE